MTATASVVARVPSGRPPGPRGSACPRFTAWRVRCVGSRERLARKLTALGARRTPSIRTSESAIAAWERGDCRPSEIRLELIAALAGRTVDFVSTWFALDLSTERSA